MPNDVREPKQKRSIETKKKIVDAGFELFSEVGYFSTNTAEIAKRAGVSTGIVYGYFKDKRDILLEVLGVYIEKAYLPTLEMLAYVEKPINLTVIIPHIIEKAIEIHKNYAKIHEALHSLTSVDETVNARFIALEDTITDRFTATLVALDYDPDGLKEKVHLAMDIIQSFAHECVYDAHDYIDYNKMTSIVCDVLIKLFK